MLLFLYLITYIDKVNIGNAKIEGLLPDLHMNGYQYNIALSIFSIPYILAEVPSNISYSIFLARHTILGIIMTCTGTIKNFCEMVAVRFLLGLFEAGLFPGAILLISRWYLPCGTQTRLALLYTSAATGGAFSGLLAFGIAKMDGIGGYEGWRWIFIIEGLLTVIMGVVCCLLLPDSPALSKWLDEDEKRFLTLRQVTRATVADVDESKNHNNLLTFWTVVSDWKVNLLILANWSQAVPNYALKFSLPTIIKGMGYKSANAQLLTIPPYACGAISSYVLSVFEDRYNWRLPFLVGPQVAVVIGYAVLFVKTPDIKHNIASCYFAVCLACSGLYPILSAVNAWNIYNTAGPAKRAISIGYLICMGNVGRIVGSYIFIEREAPRYPTGYGTSLAFGAAGIVAAFALEFFLKKSNKRNAQLGEDEIRARYTDVQLYKMGDRSPLYVYKL
ncbi:hypothetical protein LTR78_010066 [Recurvomyces mirabilis]|uniref:Major facilitator superfamily (MFS) profile domain-containing protein n=1 Tax=Recurvomyces mirabilis TaxID=574656 RepID=A0AAE0TM69_9PEZI|nr:hypothetical protein LTR78_010066 [Recurvomyces mirabilis]KAK5159828.1 hypothetical protein LTS14_001933 [Recurvomyces mirabilis]